VRKEVYLLFLLFLLVVFLLHPIPVFADWYQEGHDAQHTGYAPDNISAPWTYNWQWNGSCSGGTRCSTTDPQVGWSFYIPQKSHLVAGAGRLYLPAGDQGVYAINQTDGRTAWRNASVLSYCSAAYDPLTNSLYVAGKNGVLYRLDPATGNELGRYASGGSLNLAPTIGGGRVFVVSDNGVVFAVNILDMSLAWSYSAGSNAQIPVAYSSSRNMIVFGTEDLYVHAVSNQNGIRLWRVKPTVVNSTDGSTYSGVDGKIYNNYNYDNGWPVIAENRGVVFIRMHQNWNEGIYSVPNPPNYSPSSNAAIRSYLNSVPELKNLFAMNLSDGSTAFDPAVIFGAEEFNSQYMAMPPKPVIKQLPGGKEIAYLPWRNGQKCEAGDCNDPRWDTVMGEMVLDSSTVAGYQAGDLRFVNMSECNNYFITDETGNVTMSGDTFFYTHWLVTCPFRITDRNSSLGGTYKNPISSQKQVSLMYAVDGNGSSCGVTSNYYCSGTMRTYNDSRLITDTFWSYYNVARPYLEGYHPSYTIIDNSSIYILTRAGNIFAISTPTSSCSLKSNGDADCNGAINILDFEIWRREFLGIDATTKADFDSSGGVTILDFEIWRRGFLGV